VLSPATVLRRFDTMVGEGTGARPCRRPHLADFAISGGIGICPIWFLAETEGLPPYPTASVPLRFAKIISELALGASLLFRPNPLQSEDDLWVRTRVDRVRRIECALGIG
jgi:hypothetical protein